MIARTANLNDLPGIMVFSRAACESSPTYAPLGFNSVIWRRTLQSAFKDPTMRVFIAIDGGEVCGLLVGMISPMPWSAGFCASDLVFAADRGGDRLLELFVQWCDQRKVRRIDMGVSDSQLNDRVADSVFGRKRFRGAGRVYFRVNEVQ